jgi:hypothetical protein
MGVAKSSSTGKSSKFGGTRGSLRGSASKSEFSDTRLGASTGAGGCSGEEPSAQPPNVPRITHPMSALPGLDLGFIDRNYSNKKPSG